MYVVADEREGSFFVAAATCNDSHVPELTCLREEYGSRRNSLEFPGFEFRFRFCLLRNFMVDFVGILMVVKIFDK